MNLKKVIELASEPVRDTLQGISGVLKDAEKVCRVVHLVPLEKSKDISEVHKTLDRIYGDGWRRSYFYFVLFTDGDKIDEDAGVEVYFSYIDSRYIAESFDRHLPWRYSWNGKCVYVRYKKDLFCQILEYKIQFESDIHEELLTIFVNNLKDFTCDICSSARVKYEDKLLQFVMYDVKDKEQAEIKVSEYLRGLFVVSNFSVRQLNA